MMTVTNKEEGMTQEEFILNNEITDTDFLMESFFEFFPSYQMERNKILSAWDFLLEKTRGLSRSCGRPYFLHPMRVASILAQNNLDADSIVSGLFHNILSVPDVTVEEIEEKFGHNVTTIIQGTAKITALPISSAQGGGRKTLQQADSIRKMLFAMVGDVRVILVKLADRLDRLRNLKGFDDKTRRAVALEAIDIWAPLADRLGMSSEKNELEDLSLKYSNPDVFAQIKAIVAQKKNERSGYLEQAVNEIQAAAKNAGVEISVSSRAKHFYSIYQKMRKRNKEASELFDLLALRVLCKSVGECYTILGLVHNLWKPLEGRFKDYIAMPKSNGYQSLHTTVICHGKPLEIQIRTDEMHRVAEHGVASHWLYKKGMVIGKFVGIFSFSWLTVRLGLAPMPSHSNWHTMGAISMLGGIGFTVSIFIATLSFDGADPVQASLLSHAKLGIVIGSVLSGIIAFIWLHLTLPRSAAPDAVEED